MVLSLLRRAGRALRRRLCLPWSAIHPVDKSLILFMVLLLAQSAYTLFHPSGGSQTARDIDIIIRTSSAAIFGYFLSANFATAQAADAAGGPPRRPAPADSGTSPSLRGQIGFLPPSSQPTAGQADAAGGPGRQAFCLQVAAASGIGLFCLVVLIVLRNTAGPDAPDSAAAVQFRDFVSGCVGFLIGSPTHARSSGL